MIVVAAGERLDPSEASRAPSVGTSIAFQYTTAEFLHQAKCYSIGKPTGSPMGLMGLSRGRPV
jgi:hypothetical protein